MLIPIQNATSFVRGKFINHIIRNNRRIHLFQLRNHGTVFNETRNLAIPTLITVHLF